MATLVITSIALLNESVWSHLSKATSLSLDEVLDLESALGVYIQTGTRTAEEVHAWVAGYMNWPLWKTELKRGRETDVFAPGLPPELERIAASVPVTPPPPQAPAVDSEAEMRARLTQVKDTTPMSEGLREFQQRATRLMRKPPGQT